MNKARPDGNMEKHLAELEKHPALLKRCQEFYLARVINRISYEGLAKARGVHTATAWKYVQAYRRVAEQYRDTPEVQDVVSFCEHEIARLLQERSRATAPQEYATLTREIRAYQGMLNELHGLIDRRPQVNVQVELRQMVEIVAEEVPSAMRAYLGHVLTEDLIRAILSLSGERIKLRSEGNGHGHTRDRGDGTARPPYRLDAPYNSPQVG
jgi:hypothetical protein